MKNANNEGNGILFNLAPLPDKDAAGDFSGPDDMLPPAHLSAAELAEIAARQRRDLGLDTAAKREITHRAIYLQDARRDIEEDFDRDFR